MLILSPAKINLTLDILGKDESGLHLLQTVIQEIDLCDSLSFEKIDAGVEISCSDPAIPTDHRNLVHKAISVLAVEAEKRMGPTVDNCYDVPEAGRFGGVKVYIEKRIPMGAGLGGGSSNAAAALKACNKMWGLNWSTESLANLGAKIGMDVPFFIYGGTALATHFGEIIEPFPFSPEWSVVVVYDGIPSLTAEAYGLLNPELCGMEIERSRGLLADLMKKDQMVFGYIGNDFETLIEDGLWKPGEAIQRIKSDLKDLGAMAACLSGSGAAVFGLFTDDLAADFCRQKLSDKYKFCWKGKTSHIDGMRG